MTGLKPRAIIIGDSTNNTLSAIRSLGEAKIEQILILKCEEDLHYVSKSRYLKHSQIFQIKSMEYCMSILESLKNTPGYNQTIICTFDEAAVYIDNNEETLYPYFRTPARGKHIGNLFNKDEQCKLAEKCGLTVPKSIVFSRKDDISKFTIEYPVLLKPINSTKGEKADIHICRNIDDFKASLMAESHCQEFILQEFIDKEYEVNCLGVKTDSETLIAGGIKKLRHFPVTVGACTYGKFQKIDRYNISVDAIDSFLHEVQYHGPFSVEFLYKNGKYYFMEVNLRNDGLAYASTAAGANLHALYMNSTMTNPNKINDIFMMDYSVDFLFVKKKVLSLWTWLRDLLRTRCFININFRDLNPIIHYYKNKISSKISR